MNIIEIIEMLKASETAVQRAGENVENYALLTKPPSFYLSGVLMNMKNIEIPIYGGVGCMHGELPRSEPVLRRLRNDVANLSQALNKMDTANAKLNIAIDEKDKVEEKDLEMRRSCEDQIREVNGWGQREEKSYVWYTGKCIQQLKDLEAKAVEEKFGVEEVLEAQLETEAVEAEIREQDISPMDLTQELTAGNLVDKI